MFVMNARIAIISVVLATIINHLNGCTGTFLRTTNNHYVYARTLEFAQDLRSHILYIPRNYAFTAPTPHSPTGGLTWKSTYAVLGANGLGFPYIVDGVNEKGVAGGFFYFPGFAQYQDVPEHDSHNSLPMWQLLTWILTSFDSIAQIRKALPTIFVSDAPLSEGIQSPPAHLIVHDTNGESLVVEYVDGTLHMHENPLGIITNAPTFDWHMTNLRNYLNLSPTNPASKTIADITLSPLGQGAGLVGMPGDFTPPSRFVRIAIFTHTAPTFSSELEAVMHAFHMLNNFDIPKGSVRDRSGATEYTQWTSAIDMHHKIFYIKTYENFQLQKIAFDALDLNDHECKLFTLKSENNSTNIVTTQNTTTKILEK
jgi:choloylglycine hydrolase